MKKILLTAAVVFALGTAAQAQDMRFGVKAGVNFSNFGGDEVGDSSARTGFHVGAVAEFPLSENFSIQPEVLFSQQGSQNEFNEVYTIGGVEVRDSYEVKQTLNYINVPIAAQYEIFDGFTLHAGPQIGFLISANGKVEGTTTGGGMSQSIDTETDNKDAFETVDFSAFGGVGYELPMGLFFQARYNAGISSVIKNSEGTDSEDIKTTGNTLSVSVGFKF